MNRLKIVDLSFLETELSNSGEVQGGTGAIFQPVASVSTSYNGANTAGYFGSWAIYKDAYGGYTIAANVYGYAGGAVAGAIAGAASDGTQFTTSSAQAKAY